MTRTILERCPSKASWAGAYLASRRTVHKGNAKKLTPCKYCKTMMGVNDRRAHEPKCPKKPASVRRGRPRKVTKILRGRARKTRTRQARAPTKATEPAKVRKTAAKTPKAGKATKDKKAGTQADPKAGTKQAQVIALLKRKGGATLAEMMTRMSWQKHTVRGFIAGALKKLGYTVASTKSEAGERTYAIEAK
jgi:hypothetical protein